MSAPARRAAQVAVGAAMLLALAILVPRTRLPLSFDATHTYLPMAKQVLAEGWAYLQRPDSLATAPFAFLYPALLGADGHRVQWANVIAFLALIGFCAHAAGLAHSVRAGVLAAFAVALAPTLHPYIADASSEAPFLVLVGAWIACVARVAAGGRVPWMFAGAAALALSALTRPAIMYFAPLMALVFAVRALRTPSQRAREWRLAALHAAAAAAIALWIVRNAMVFGFPAVAAGTGGALFLGVNPIVDGSDPTYYGLIYDVGAVAQNVSHLSIEGDRILRGVALTELRDTPLGIVLPMFARKVAAFLFVTPAEPGADALRAWRIALLVLAALALWRTRSIVALSLGALVGYLVAIHIPVLYTYRYSVGAIDLPLAVLGAIGLAEASASAARIGATAAVAILGIGAGWILLPERGPLAPHFERAPTELIWSGAPAGRFEVAPEGGIEVTITGAPRFHPWDTFILVLEMAVAPEAHCAGLRLRYRGLADSAFAEARVLRVPLRSDGRMRTLQVGGAMPLGLNHEGVLRLEFECAHPASVEMGKITVHAPRRATYYREMYLSHR